MRKTTKGKGFLGAVLVTITVAVLMFLLTGALLTGYFGGDTEPFATGVVLFFALLYLAVALGAINSLYRRWKDIQGGEEDEAKRY